MGELLIILVIVLLVFGANKLPQLGDGIGKAIKNFKRGINHDDDIDVTPTDKRVAAEASSRVGSKLDDANVRDAEVIESKASKS
jgi:sec-independent protein translocase protein TatA